MPEQSHENPFATSAIAEALVDPAIENMDQAEQIRREHLNRETSVRGIGSLFYVGTIVLILFIASTVWSRFPLSNDGRPVTVQLFSFGMLGLVVLFAVVQGWVGHGLRTLNGSVRLWAVALSALGLINFPIGTVISIYFIYVLVSAKGQFVMTPEYAAIRAATPHIRYKTPIWLWIVLGFLVLLLLLLPVVILGRD
jgi:hypothetical protein